MFLKKLVKSEFGKNVLTLFSGTTIAQVIPFFIAPILTRLYAPEDFGLLALFLSTAGLIAIISTLQYESAIILPKKDEDAINLVALSLIIDTIITISVLLIVVFFNKTIASWLGNEKLAFWLYFVPIIIFLKGLYSTLNYWSSRKKQYKRLAIRAVSQSVTTAGVKLAMGLKGATNSGLITGTLIGQFTASSVLTWLTWRDDKNLLQHVTKKRIIKNAKIYKDFPRFTAWHSFFDIFNSSGVNFIISANFGAAILGLYSFALGLIQKPLRLIGNAVTQVYYQRITEIYNKGEDIWPLTKKIIIKLIQVGLIIFIPIAIAGPKIFEFIFGEKWIEAGIYARLITPWIFVRFVGSPITSIVKTLEKQKEFFINIILYNISIPLLFYFFSKLQFDFNIILLISSFFSATYLTVLIFWIRKIIIHNQEHE